MLGGLVAIALASDTTAHDLFTSYIQHNVRIAVGERHIDVQMELTFFEEWSARERALMDTDANGRISRKELGVYVRKLTPELGRQVGLAVGGRKRDLELLYDPELDLLGSERTGPGHHRICLYLFARTPAALRAGDEVVVEDRLWPQAKALGTVQGEGRDGCVLSAHKNPDPAFAPARAGEARLFKLRCVKPPGKESAATSRKQ